ncbi:F-box domain, partial [Arabidopsis thaliana x Arabidopsis arenosa]
MTKMSKLLTLVKLSRLPVTSLRGIRSVCKKGNTLSKHRRCTRKRLAQAKTATKKELPTKMTMVSDLPRDLAEDVLLRLPMTSMRAVRSVCKQWNSLSKDFFFTKKHLAQEKAAAAREFMVVMVMDYRVYLMGINLHKDVEETINCQGKLISLDDSNQVDISTVYHCDGLVLCIPKDCARLVVWNPYWGQTLWFKPSSIRHEPHLYRYAVGYQNSKSCRSYKILRFVEVCAESIVEYEINELNSNSWRVLDVTSDWHILFFARGVTLKGNTYWFAIEKYREGRSTVVEIPDFLICFDFTTERFGPRLRLPFRSYDEDTVTLSSVREEQLAVLFQREDNLHLEIWVTTKIEPEVVSWSKLFLAVDMEPLTDFQFGVTGGSFFIDEEKKLAVVFDKDKDRDNVEVQTPRHNFAYIIGEDGYFRDVDLGETSEVFDCPLGCLYVPSSVQIKQRVNKRK